MASQALVITAYKDFPQLERIICRFIDFHIFIHIDKKYVRKSKLDYCYLRNKYSSNNLHFYSKYSIGWGSFNHLLAILFLLKKVKDTPGINYIHIISGQDHPVKGSKVFSCFDNDSSVYLNCFHLVETPLDIQSRYNRKHWFAPFFSIISRDYQRIDKFIARHFLFPVRRIGRFEFNQLYKGLIWASFPIEVLNYICDYVSSFAGMLFMIDLRFCEIPEELFLQTIIMNSDYRNRVNYDNLRYSLWEEKNGSDPAVLDTSDYENIIKSGAFFCRKIDSDISHDLLDMLEQRALYDS